MPGPFDPNDAAAYAAWRERKLADHPRRLEEVIVEVRTRATSPPRSGRRWRTGLRGATWRSMRAARATTPTRTS